MAIIQGLIHFTTLTMVNAIRRLSIDPGEIESYSSPLYRLRMDFTNRILNQNPELYADIEMLNQFLPDVLKSYLRETKTLFDIVRKKDKKEFLHQFKQASTYMNRGKRQSKKRTDRILEFAANL